MSLYVFRLCSDARKNGFYATKDADRFFLFHTRQCYRYYRIEYKHLLLSRRFLNWRRWLPFILIKAESKRRLLYLLHNKFLMIILNILHTQDLLQIIVTVLTKLSISIIILILKDNIPLSEEDRKLFEVDNSHTFH